MIKHSVIVPCLNAEAFIGHQLEALAHQTWKGEWEILIADNGSTDGTLAVVRKYEQLAGMPRIRVIDAGRRRGVAAARNCAAAVAEGQNFLFCDADDEVCPGWLAAMDEALALHEVVAGPLETEKLNQHMASDPDLRVQVDGLQHLPGYPDYAGGGNLGVRRDVHRRIGGFDESLPTFEDVDYSWRLQLAGVRIHFTPAAVLHYRFRSGFMNAWRQAYGYGYGFARLGRRHRLSGNEPRLRQLAPQKRPATSGSRFTRRLRRLFGLLLGPNNLLTTHGRRHLAGALAFRFGKFAGSISRLDAPAAMILFSSLFSDAIELFLPVLA